MRTKLARNTADVPTDYFALVRAFPLKPIRDERTAAKAWAMVERLAPVDERKLTAGQKDYLHVLADLVDEYDRQRHPVGAANLDAVDYLKHLLEQAAMNASDLGRLLGNRALGGKILRRERELSKAHVLKLAQHFRVEPGLFLRTALPPTTRAKAAG